MSIYKDYSKEELQSHEATLLHMLDKIPPDAFIERISVQSAIDEVQSELRILALSVGSHQSLSPGDYHVCIGESCDDGVKIMGCVDPYDAATEWAKGLEFIGRNHTVNVVVTDYYGAMTRLRIAVELEPRITVTTL